MFTRVERAGNGVEVGFFQKIYGRKKPGALRSAELRAWRNFMLPIYISTLFFSISAKFILNLRRYFIFEIRSQMSYGFFPVVEQPREDPQNFGRRGPRSGGSLLHAPVAVSGPGIRRSAAGDAFELLKLRDFSYSRTECGIRKMENGSLAFSKLLSVFVSIFRILFIYFFPRSFLGVFPSTPPLPSPLTRELFSKLFVYLRFYFSDLVFIHLIITGFDRKSESALFFSWFCFVRQGAISGNFRKICGKSKGCKGKQCCNGIKLALMNAWAMITRLVWCWYTMVNIGPQCTCLRLYIRGVIKK